MASLLDLYRSRRSLAEHTFKQANDALKAYVSDRGFFVIGRLKEYESLIDKLQSGRYASFADIDDLIAFSIIIDARDQEKEVLAYLSRTFDLMSIRQNTATRAEIEFPFDCTRAYLKLRNTKIASDENRLLFEVQIRTLLQHAWVKKTHAEVYKAGRLNSRKARLAAETLAQIESLDRVLSTFATTSKSVKRIRKSSLENLNHICSAFDHLFDKGFISSEFRVKNNKRLAENVANLIHHREASSIRKAAEVIESYVEKNAPSVPTSISLFEIALVALEESGLLKNKTRPLYMSDEFLTFFPHMKKYMSLVLQA